MTRYADPLRGPVTTGSMSGTAVPKILLTLGAGCLLVAALVFLAVTWSVMGVGGRTATLVGFTTLTGVLTCFVAQRGLRGATESLGLVTIGLVALDAVGADNAGWLGNPDAAAFSVLLGMILAGTAASACVLLRRTPAGAFTSGELVIPLAVALATGGLVGGDWGAVEGRLLVATLACVAAVALLDGLALATAATLSGAVALFTWCSLAAAGYDRLVDDPSFAGVWQDRNGWPALAAAALALGLVGRTRLPLAARQTAASVAAALVASVLVVPGLDEGATAAAFIGIAVLTVSAGVLLLPGPWNATAWISLAISGLGVFVTAALLVAVAGSRWLDEAATHGLIGDRLEPAGLQLSPWLLPPAVASLLLALVAAARPPAWERMLPWVALLTVLTTATLFPVPVALLVGAALLAGAAYVVRRGLGMGVLCLSAGTVLSLHSDGLLVIALATVLAAAWWTHLREELQDISEGAALVAQVALAGSAWAWGLLLDRPGTWVAAFGIAAVSAVPFARRSVGLEVGAALGACGLFVAGTGHASFEQMPTWAAVYLTLVGVATCAYSLLREDRRELAWVGGLLLAMATWVRLADLGVNEPEPYTLPSALALLVVGLVRLRRHPGSDTLQALGAGLTLALVPSLLWVLDEPATPRSLYLGLACLALVVVGVQARWTAPLCIGAAVGALVVLRHAAPYLADASVPRWALIGSAGTLLLVLGITWEQRVTEARRMLGYVRGLR